MFSQANVGRNKRTPLKLYFRSMLKDPEREEGGQRVWISQRWEACG